MLEPLTAVLGTAGLLTIGIAKFLLVRSRQGRRQLKLLEAVIQDAMIVEDQAGRITLCNEAAEKLFGYGRQELLGRGVRMVLPGGLHDAWEGKAAWTAIESVAVRKDRTELPVEVTTSALKLKGRWHTVGMVRDISERKQREEESRRAKEHAEEMASELAGVN